MIIVLTYQRSYWIDGVLKSLSKFSLLNVLGIIPVVTTLPSGFSAAETM